MVEVECIKISVDCVENDAFDIRCGGPLYLGFDFYIEVDKVEEMITFIRETLKEFKIPLINIYESEKGKIPIDKLFTKEKIVRCVKKDAVFLIDEAKERKKIHRRK